MKRRMIALPRPVSSVSLCPDPVTAGPQSTFSPKLLEEVVAPLMARIGDLWEQGTLRIAHEHMATAAVRNFFASLGRGYEIPAHAPSIVIATPLGQIHEVGALIAEAAALSMSLESTTSAPS